MRKWVKFLVLWAISGTLSYVYGIPYAIEYMQPKTREQAYTQCVSQLRSQGMIGLETSALTPSQGDEYCHCMADPLLFTRDDLFDMAKQKPPAHLTEQAKSQNTECNKTLEENLSHNQPIAPASPPTPAARDIQPDGTEVVHF